MPVIAVPNVSEGRDHRVVSELARACSTGGVRVLDTHSDPEHNRTVFTVTGPRSELVHAMAQLAEAAGRAIDLTRHDGLHPRLGCLDVAAFVAFEEPGAEAVGAARRAADEIGHRGLPVYLYGEAHPLRRALHDLRRGGLAALTERCATGLRPDRGPDQIDPRAGVVCVGARGILIAFNAWLDAGPDVARSVASLIRERSGGLRGVRALGLRSTAHGGSQISMNLVEPEHTGIDEVLEAIERHAGDRGATVTATEIVGLPPERFLPSEDATAARLLIEPGRSLESALDA